MVSINAENVAKEILGTIGTKKKPSVRAIAPKYGYSPTTANSGQIQQTQSYKNVMNPVIKQMEKERQRAIKAMTTKDLDDVRYNDLSDVIDKLTKNIQLLSGGATENLAVQGVEISIRK